MKTFLVGATVKFKIRCRNDNKLADSAYRQLGYNVKTYSELVLDELKNVFVLDVSKPRILQIE